MPFQQVQLGLLLVHHIIDRGGDGPLSIKGSIIGVGIQVRFLEVDVIVSDEPAAFSALHDEAVVRNSLIRILLGKGGENIRILFDDFNIVREAFILAQQVLDHLILFAGLYDPVDRHVLFQCVHHHLCVAGDGVEL